MSNGVPQLKIDEIRSDLTRLLDRADTDSFELRRTEASVERLWQQRAINVVDYYTIKSFIEFGKYRREAAIDAANNVLRLAPGDAIAQSNVLSLKIATMEIDEAISMLEKMTSELRDDVHIIRTLIIKSADMLQYETAVKLYAVIDKLLVNDSSSKYLRRPLIERACAAMKRNNLSDSDSAERLKAAYGALRDESYGVWRTSRTILNDGTTLYFMHIKADADQCALLNFSIADRLVEQFEDPGSEVISFACRPVTDLPELVSLPEGAV
jgi:tetratricopeptide (TPR) repeat protein